MQMTKNSIWRNLMSMMLKRRHQRCEHVNDHRYGLKESPSAWFDRFLQIMISRDFTMCNVDSTIFEKHFPFKSDVL